MRTVRNVAFLVMAVLAVGVAPGELYADESCTAVAEVQCQVDVPDWFHDSEGFCAEKCPNEPYPVGECDFHSTSAGCEGEELRYSGNCDCSAEPIVE